MAPELQWGRELCRGGTFDALAMHESSDHARVAREYELLVDVVRAPLTAAETQRASRNWHALYRKRRAVLGARRDGERLIRRVRLFSYFEGRGALRGKHVPGRRRTTSNHDDRAGCAFSRVCQLGKPRLRTGMSIEAVVFDWGGTLSFYADIELIDMWQLAAERLALETGRDADELRDKLLAAELRYWEGVKRTQRTGSLIDILQEESLALGLDVTGAVIEEVASRHLDAWTPHIRHHADAVATLSRLREQGLKIGLLSNTHWPESFHEHFLERDGLVSLIDERAYTSNMSHSKPHRAAFVHILERLAVAPEHAVMVGDRPIDDVWGGQQIGMRGVWRPHAASPALGDVKPDAVIEQLMELPAIVAGW